MGTKMTWGEIKQAYPNEWVAIANETTFSELPYDNIEGVVVAHATSDDVFTSQIKNLSNTISDLDIRFTGEILPDNPIGPVLWRISDLPS